MLELIVSKDIPEIGYFSKHECLNARISFKKESYFIFIVKFIIFVEYFWIF